MAIVIVHHGTIKANDLLFSSQFTDVCHGTISEISDFSFLLFFSPSSMFLIAGISFQSLSFIRSLKFSSFFI